ncbi:MAG: hypothetical protein M3407_09455 [Acidobacteriota bacterium]|nr:hypothetical protein [Acidobacteriota bacterium]
MQVIYATGRPRKFAFASADTKKNVPAGATVLAICDSANVTEHINGALFELLTDGKYYTLRALINDAAQAEAARPPVSPPAPPAVARGWFNSLSGWLSRADRADEQELHLA